MYTSRFFQGVASLLFSLSHNASDYQEALKKAALSLPPAIQQILQAHAGELETLYDQWHRRGRFGMFAHLSGSGTKETAWLPGYILKYDAKRIIGREKIATYLTAKHYTNIAVATKHLLPLSPTKEIVVAQKINGVSTHQKPINVAQARELIDLIKEVGINDLRSSNLIMHEDQTEKKTICYIIDTDPKSFCLGSTIGFLKFYYCNDFEPEAAQLVWQEVKKSIRKIIAVKAALATTVLITYTLLH
jgi:hypothetical protein